MFHGEYKTKLDIAGSSSFHLPPYQNSNVLILSIPLPVQFTYTAYELQLMCMKVKHGHWTWLKFGKHQLFQPTWPLLFEPLSQAAPIFHETAKWWCRPKIRQLGNLSGRLAFIGYTSLEGFLKSRSCCPDSKAYDFDELEAWIHESIVNPLSSFCIWM